MTATDPMDVKQFLLELRRLGVTLAVVDGKLRSQGAKGALTPLLQGQIRAHKDAIVAFLSNVYAQNEQRERIPAADRSQPLPLSYAQERLWFLEQLNGQSSTLNMPSGMRLRGHIDAALLERAVQCVVDRHESLRTRFIDAGDAPAQQIVPALAFPLPLIDLSALPAPEREAQVARRREAEAMQPFDIAQAPLLRVLLLRLAADEHVLLFTMHHIISDGWSLAVFGEELVAAYAALAAGREPALPPLPIQYGDFALWQRQWLQGETLQRQIRYWRACLSDLPEPLDLPLDFRRPPQLSYAGASEGHPIEPAILEPLKRLSQVHGATLFMTLFAAFNVMLQRLSGQHDILVGTPNANRTRGEVEGLIGFFLNNLVLRTDLSGDPSFVDLLERVRTRTLDAYAHQDLPFEKILEEVQPPRDLSRTPLFQVCFNMLNLPGGPAELPGLSAEALPTPEVGSKFDLTLYVEEAGGGLTLSVVYNTSLFGAARIREMLSQYRALLAQIGAAPERSISSHSLLTDAARDVLPAPTSRLDCAWPGPVHALFSAHARARPERLALVDAAGRWRYGEIDAHSNRLAHYLLSKGLQREHVVAIYAARDPWLACAIMAVLKAGGAFLILDPAYPDERLVEIVELTRPAQLLQIEAAGQIGAQLDVALDALTDGARIRLPSTLDAAQLPWRDCSDATPAIAIGANDLACIACTSGSTGKPKAIAGRHGSLSHFLPWQAQHFGLSADDRWSMLSGLAHDPLQRDVFGALCSGASLWIPHAEEFAPERLAHWLSRSAISVANLTPAMSQIISECRETIVLDALRVGFVVGDMLTRRDVARLTALAPRLQVVNLYGATETQRALSCYRVDAAAADAAAPQPKEVIPIGRGMHDCQLLILNRDGQLAGIGEVGEICIRSQHLARGYLHDPQQTAERFSANPFADADPDDRLYRSGDLGRYLPDGNVECIGRADQQVKIRGFRIELGEIEAQLGQNSAVREAVVVARNNAVGDKQLVAYWVARDDTAVADDPALELRRFLKLKLPDYMVPATFVRLDRLPLNPNGKLDRKALPAPNVQHDHGAALLAPRSDNERLLAGFWCELLGLEQVGARDNFFALGGHSLLVTRLVSRVRSALQVDLPLRAVFEHDSLAELAAHLDTLAVGARSATPALVPVARDGRLPLSFPQQRLWFLDQLQGSNATYNMPAALRLSGALDIGALVGAIQVIVDRHESLRTSFAEIDGEPVQVIAAALRVDVPVVAVSERSVAEAVAAFAQTPFDLARGPLFRAQLLRLAPNQHVLLTNMHHIISDGWSIGVLVNEFVELYCARLERRAPQLPALPIQYADFAHWQRDWLQGDALQRQLDYWRAQLAGLPPLLDLPTDRPRPPLQSFNGANLDFSLSPQLTQDPKRLSQAQGATLFMTLLAAFQLLLARYCGQDDIAVGTPIANRTRTELEGLIGFFVNTLVLRARIEGGQGFADLLGQVRRTTLAAYEHQDVPFEQLVEQLNPARDMSHAPLFQVLFALQNTPRGTQELPGLELTPLEGGSNAARFDLSLSLDESEGGLSGTMQFNTDLFDRERIERMVEHYRELLAGAVADPNRALAVLPLLTAPERRQMLVDWNASETEEQPERFVHDVFATQAARTPHAVALTDGAQSLTYAELDCQSNRLAQHLRAQGVGPEVLVGLCLERSLDIVIAVLAVLKAGGAYVPLDPAYPDARLAGILADAQVGYVLTHAALAERDALQGVRRFCLDRERAMLLNYPGAPLRHRCTLDNLAYQISTSGSTGRPKGVQVTHRGLFNLATEFAAHCQVTARSRVLQFASIGFDASVVEIVIALCAGATLYVACEERELAAPDLAARLHAQGIDMAILPPSLLAQLAPESLPLLRTVVSAGEACSAELIARWAPGRRFINAYGPSESTVCATLTVCPPAQARVSIGKVIANIDVYVLDAHWQPVPIGVPGELYIGGLGLARGYCARPDLSAERFIPHPFSTAPGQRLYRTGDLVRWLADGELEFVGRTDHQIKLRGFRIELGEIEAVLLAQEGVREAVAVLREDAPGDPRLVAYLTTSTQVTVSALRAALRRELPEHMLPSAFVTLTQLPLSSSGKIDRRALPAPEYRAAGDGHIAPRNAIEARVAETFAAVLRLDRVGVHDNFFELGGHSLLAMQLVVKLRERFGVALPVREVFAAPTVARMALHLQDSPAAQWSPLVPIQIGNGRSAQLFLIHAQGGTVMSYADLARALGPDHTVYGVQARGIEAGQEPLERIDEMAALYVAAMRELQPQGPYHIAGWSLGGSIALEMAQQLRATGDSVAFLGLLDTIAPCTSTAPMPTRAAMLAGLWGPALGLGEEDLAPLDEEQQLALVLSRAAQTGALPEGFGFADAARQLRVLEANTRAVADFRPEPYAGQAVLFQAQDKAKRVRTEDWDRFVIAGVTLHAVAGDHLSMMAPPQVESLANLLRPYLGQLDGPSQTRRDDRASPREAIVQ